MSSATTSPDRICLRPVLRVFCYLFFLSLLCGSAKAENLQQQRNLYEKALQYLRSGQISEYEKLLPQLESYPLYPYLVYARFSPRLHKLGHDQVRWFLENHGDLPDADNLRSRWLLLLARRNDWQAFADFYTPQNDRRLQCLYLLARLNINNHIYLLEDIRSLWLTGDSLPDECDKPFRHFYSSDLIDDDVIWQRIRLAMENGKTGLANYLGKKLSAELRPLQQRWQQLHQNPYLHTKKTDLPDDVYAREILVYGIQRLAQRNIKQALQRWQGIKLHYSYSPTETAQLERFLAIRAASKDHPDAVLLLDRVEPAQVDEEVFLYRLKAALELPDWRQLLHWTEGFPTLPEMSNQWWYWRGRALQETGEIEQARQAFRRVAGERDYYGFLAADQLGRDYKMNHYPLPENLKDKQVVAEMPGIRRAHEFYQMRKYYPARREWHHALNSMTRVQMQMAATIAKEWGWYDRAIFALGKAKIYDDLVLRFPLLHKDLLSRYAGKRSLDLGWVYGLVRAESAFVEDARSPVGALGLMQVMPATGSETARAIGLKNFRPDRLLEAEVNVPIGSAYLKQMLSRFNGNPLLATAAYNAGPHRIRQWLPKSGCMSPDVWVEKIPFRETRKYVKRVLSYASIYDWRLEAKPVALNARMLAVLPDKQTQAVASLGCSIPTVTMR